MNSPASTSHGDSLHLPEGIRHEQLAEIVELLKGLRFGSVQIIVQDGVIVQMDRTEKKRIVRGPITSAKPSREN